MGKHIWANSGEVVHVHPRPGTSSGGGGGGGGGGGMGVFGFIAMLVIGFFLFNCMASSLSGFLIIMVVIGILVCFLG